MSKSKAVGLIALAVLSACSTTEQHRISRIESPMPAASPPPHVVARIEDPLNDPNSLLSRRSVYFADDSMVVQEADRELLLAHARYLADHPEARLRLEGNCDERGSNEYNLALGEGRARRVKSALLLMGAKEQQIETVSYGEEKPKALGHDETSWQQNRRVDLNYLGKGSSTAPGKNRPLSRIEAPSLFTF